MGHGYRSAYGLHELGYHSAESVVSEILVLRIGSIPARFCNMSVY